MSSKEIANQARLNGLHPNTVKYRLKKGEPIESAISRPASPGRVATKPKYLKGEKLAKYNLSGELLTLPEIATRFNINYNTLYYQVVKRNQEIASVVERLSKTTTADGILRLIDTLPIEERNKLLLKLSLPPQRLPDVTGRNEKTIKKITQCTAS